MAGAAACLHGGNRPELNRRWHSHSLRPWCSPHVVSLAERVAVDAAPIAGAALDALTDRHGDAIAAVRQQQPALSHFEVLTGLALRHFADQKVGASLGNLRRRGFQWPALHLWSSVAADTAGNIHEH